MGSVKVRREGAVVVGYFHGHVTEQNVIEMRDQVNELLRASPSQYVLMDTSEVTGFDPAVRGPAVPWLAELKKSGVHRLYAIAPNSLVRMMGSAIGLAAGLSLRFVKDRAEFTAETKAALDSV